MDYDNATVVRLALQTPDSFLTSYALKTEYEVQMDAANFRSRVLNRNCATSQISSAKAFNVGWTTRPLADTA